MEKTNKKKDEKRIGGVRHVFDDKSHAALVAENPSHAGTCFFCQSVIFGTNDEIAAHILQHTNEREKQKTLRAINGAFWGLLTPLGLLALAALIWVAGNWIMTGTLVVPSGELDPVLQRTFFISMLAFSLFGFASGYLEG